MLLLLLKAEQEHSPDPLTKLFESPSQADRHFREVLCFFSPLLQVFSLWSCSVRILPTVMRMDSRRKRINFFLLQSDLENEADAGYPRALGCALCSGN